MNKNGRNRTYSVAIACFLFLFFVVFALASTNPAFIPPSPSDSEIVDGLISFNFTFDGIVNWTLNLDNGTVFQICSGTEDTSPQNCTWNASASPEGTYDANLTTINSSDAGDSNSTTISNFVIEHPIGLTLLSPTPTSNSNLSGSVTFNVSFSSLADRKINFTYTGGSGTVCDNTDVSSPSTCNWNTAGEVDDDNYTIYIRAEDNNNATDIDIITLTSVTVDNTAPNATLVSPANLAIFNTTNRTFNWTTNDAIDTDVSCDLIINDVVNQTFSEAVNSTSIIFAEGNHTWSVNCTDYTGNVNATATRSFVVDSDLPVLGQINFTPISASNYTNASPVISFAVTENNLLSCEYNIGNGTWLSMTENTTNAPNNICSVQVSTQTHASLLNISFRATDIASNVNQTNPLINVTVDATAPTLSLNLPTGSINYTDGNVITINATAGDVGGGILNNATCAVDIGGYTDEWSGTVNYNATTGFCFGNITLDNPSSLPRNQFAYTLTLEVNDSVNNSVNDTVSINIDNAAPEISIFSTSASGNVVASNTTSFVLTVRTFDDSIVQNVLVGNASNVTLANISQITNTFENFTATTNASALGCPASGVCTLTAYANDSFGMLNNTQTISLIIDVDTPTSSNVSINSSGPIGLKEPVIISALWNDSSLLANYSSTATLYKINETTTAIQNMSLNSSNQWSNFTYLPFPNVDEGENITFYISYTDLVGNSNTTTNVSVTVANVSPTIQNLTVLNRSTNISDETPTIYVRYSDQGKGITNTNTILSLTNSSSGQNVSKAGTWTCETLNTYSESGLGIDDSTTFSTSSYSATSYSFVITNITNANSSSATVTIERANYPRSNSTTLSSWTDSYDFEDIRVTLVNTTNVSGNSSWLSFTDLGYVEYQCNYTFSTLQENTYNISLILTDSANNTNSSRFSWLVDGYRPIFANLTANAVAVITNSASVDTEINASDSVDNTLNVSYVLNETYLNFTRIYVDSVLAFFDNSTNTINESLIALEPGAHNVSLQAHDVVYASTQNETNTSFVVHFNAQANMTKLQQEINDSLNLSNSLQVLNIKESGTILNNNESLFLNNSIGFDIRFNTSQRNITINVSPIWGLYYNWNNTDISLDTNNASTFATQLSTATGISIGEIVRVQNYTATSEDFTKFLPQNRTQQVNWSFSSTTNFVGTINDEDASQIYLLQTCGGSTAPENFDEACYEQNGTNITVYTPEFTGIFFGNDSGAPNITVQGFPANDSTFSFNISVIEPSANTTNFCSYNISLNGTLVDSQTLDLTDFSLNYATYISTRNYSYFNDSTLYTLNISCTDSLGNTATYGQAFTVNDTITPVISQVSQTILARKATITFETDEYSQVRINYSTNEENITTQTDWEAFGTDHTIVLLDLTPETTYYYKLEACDLNDNCVLYPSSGISAFSTEQENQRNSGSGGGGGGGLTEGTIIGSYSRLWNELGEGLLTQAIDNDAIAVKVLEVLITNTTSKASLEVVAYLGKAPTVPRYNQSAFQYFKINHKNIIGINHKMSFTVPTSWLEQNNVTQIHVLRLENNTWIEYPINKETDKFDVFEYEVALPGFSYFVIGATTENQNTSIYVPPSVAEDLNKTPEEIISEVENNTNQGTVVEYATQNSSMLWKILLLILLVGAAAGGWYYYTYYVVKATTKNFAAQKFNETDPFVEVQKYIFKALNHGYSQEQIKEKLLGAGWDELIVDEEIEKILLKHIDT